MEKIRYYIYIPVSIIVIYITWMAVTNNDYPFTFGYINFSKDDVNNYSSLLGTLIGLFGVVLLVETLWLQFKQFKSSGKQKEKDEKLDIYYKLSLLEVDLEFIIKDIENKSEKIKEYYEAEKKQPLYTHMLFRTPSRNYTRILEIDRLSIYKAFKKFLGHNENWLKIFNNLFNVLDYLPEVFKDIYEKYESHYKDIFDQKMTVRTKLIELMNLGSKLLTDYKIEKEGNYLDFPASSIINNMIARYYDTISESQDDSGNIISETNMEKVSDYVLKKFLDDFLNQREHLELFDRRLEPIAEIAQELRKSIYLIKTRTIEFANNIELQYNNLNIDSEKDKSIITIIKEIQVMIKEGLNKIDIENI